MDLPPGCIRPLSPAPTSHLRLIGHLGATNACGTLQGPRVNRPVFTPHSHHNQLTLPAFSCSEHSRLTPFGAGLCPQELRLSLQFLNTNLQPVSVSSTERRDIPA